MKAAESSGQKTPEEKVRDEPDNCRLSAGFVHRRDHGCCCLYFVVRVLNALGWVKGDILLAIGHIFLHRRKNALQLGLLLHVVTSMAFAPLYLLILSKIGVVALPGALVVGAFFGFFHGLFVSLALVWVSSNQPMLPEFTGARLPFGVMHCAGHIAYGAAVGCVIALVLG